MAKDSKRRGIVKKWNIEGLKSEEMKRSYEVDIKAQL